MAKRGILFANTCCRTFNLHCRACQMYFNEAAQIAASPSILTMHHLIPSWASAISTYIDSVMSLGLDITFQMLPRIEPPPNQEQDHKPETLVTLFVDAHKPLVKDAIAKYLLSSTASLAAVVLDVFCTSMIDVADELGIPAYVYFTSNAAMLSLMFYLNKYYYSLDINSNNLEGDICVAAFPPVPVFSVQMVMDKNDVACKMFLHHGQRYGEARGIIVNPFEELEPMALKVLVDGECPPSPDHPMLPVFPVGPLLAPEKKSDGSEPHECIKWLDGIFVLWKHGMF